MAAGNGLVDSLLLRSKQPRMTRIGDHRALLALQRIEPYVDEPGPRVASLAIGAIALAAQPEERSTVEQVASATHEPTSLPPTQQSETKRPRRRSTGARSRAGSESTRARSQGSAVAT